MINFKKALAIALCCFITATAPVHTQAATKRIKGRCGNSLFWEYNTGKLTITGGGKIADTEFAPWYKKRNEIKNIEISERVTNIGDKVFSGLEQIKSVNVPDKVRAIGWRSFDGCTSLTKITLSPNIVRIDDAAFSNCVKLKSIEIPKQVKVIRWLSFDDCKSLANVSIPNGVTVIEEGAFAGCESLKTITIPASVTRIDEYAFGYNHSEYSGAYKKMSNQIVIKGYRNSAAERYARENQLTFVSLDKKPAVTNVTLSETTKILKRGSSFQLNASVTGTTAKVTWTSSNKAIATVNQNGKVVAKKVGRVIITAKAAGKTAKCTVTVKK